MTPDQVKFVIDEIERRWRERTPAKNVGEALPESRVNRSEFVLIFKQINLTPPILNDDFDKALFILFDRLKKEFPDERWEPRKHMNAFTRQRRKELGLS